MTDTAPSTKPPAAAIYTLTIERFRGITSLKWKPSRGVNVILGGGDVGKTTILEAIVEREWKKAGLSGSERNIYLYF